MEGVAAIVKLKPGFLAEIPKAGTAGLQVTPNFGPRLESNVIIIWDLAVAAEVCTTTALFPAGTTTEPAAADAQYAGEAEVEQF